MMDHIEVIHGVRQLTGVIHNWKQDQTFVIHRAHPIWYDEYNYFLFIEYKHTSSYLLLQQETESIINNSDLLNLIPCGIDLTCTPFSDTTIITYELELPTAGKKLVFNLLDDEYFTIHYVIDTI